MRNQLDRIGNVAAAIGAVGLMLLVSRGDFAAEQAKRPTGALVFLAPSPVAPLVEAKLLETPAVAWVERAEIDKVLKEQRLAALLGAEAGKDRVALGRLLRADLLVLAEPASKEDKTSKEERKFVRLVVADTAGGLRLLAAEVPLAADPAEDAGEIVRLVRRGLAKYGETIKEVYTVPPFFSRDLTYEHDYLKTACAGIIERRLLARPGTVVVELAEANAIAREIRLTGAGDAVAHRLPLHVEGAYRNQGVGPQRRIQLTLEVKRGETPVSKTEKTVAPDGLPAVLWEATDALCAAGASAVVASDPAAEARELARQADAFLRLAEWRDASSLYEASLLLAPQQGEVRKSALEAALKLAAPPPISPSNDAISRSLGYERQAVEHLRRLIADRAIESAHPQAPFFLRDRPAFYALGDGGKLPAEVAAFRRELIADEQAVLLQLAEYTAHGRSFLETGRILRFAMQFAEPADRYREVLRMILKHQKDAPPERLLNELCRERISFFPNSCESRKMLRDLIKTKGADPKLVAAARAKLKELESGRTLRMQSAADAAAPAVVALPAAANEAGNGARIVPRPVALVWEPEPTESNTNPRINGCFPAGTAGDVLWNARNVYLMHEKGKPKRVFQPAAGQHRELDSVVYDGRYVWITGVVNVKEPLVAVLDPASGRLWPLTAKDGLPLQSQELPGHAGLRSPVLKALGIGPGKAILAGWFGRTWLARVEFNPTGRHKVRVFHEARDVAERSHNRAAPVSAVFRPAGMVLLGGAGQDQRSGQQRLLINRYGMNPLDVDPDRLSVAVYPGNWRYHTDWDMFEGALYFTGPYSPKADIVGLVRCTAAHPEPEPLIAQVAPGRVLLEDGVINIVGYEWWRGRLADRKLEKIGRSPWRYETNWGAVPDAERNRPGWANANLYCLGRSRHYGLLAQSDGGKWPNTQIWSEIRLDGPERTVESGPIPERRPAVTRSTRPRVALGNGVGNVEGTQFPQSTETLSLSHDGARLVLMQIGAAVYTTKDLRLVRSFRDQRMAIQWAALSPDGTRLVTLSPAALRVWDVDAGTELCGCPGDRFHGPIVFLHDGEHFALGYSENVAILGNLRTRELLPIESLSSVVGVLPDGSLVGESASSPKKLLAWQPQSPGCRVLWDELPAELLGMAPDGTRIATLDRAAGNDQATGAHLGLQVWNLADRREIHPSSPEGPRLLWTTRINDKLYASEIAHNSAYDAGPWEFHRKLADAPKFRLTAKGVSLETVAQSLVTDNIVTVVPSPDQTRIAYARSTGGKWSVRAGGVDGKSYETVIENSLVFSPDGKRLAYVAGEHDKSFVVVDGVDGPHYDAVTGGLWFSPDSKRVAYVAFTAKRRMLVVDGVAGKAYDSLGVVQSPFSPDSRRVAYMAVAGDKRYVVVDGVEGQAWPGLAKDCLAFSPDSRRLAYVAARDGRFLPVIDDVEGKPCDGIKPHGIVFSPDGRQTAYLAERDGRWRAVVDGVEQKAAYDETNGTTLIFSRDGKRLAFAAQRNDRWLMVLDGVEQKPYESLVVDTFRFSPDSRRTAYAAVRDEQFVLVVDGVEGKPLRTIYPGSVTFSPDSRHVACLADGTRGNHVLVDGLSACRHLGSPRGARILFDTPQSFHVLRFDTKPGHGSKLEFELRRVDVEILAP